MKSKKLLAVTCCAFIAKLLVCALAVNMMSGTARAQTVGYVDIERVTAKSKAVNVAVRKVEDQMLDLRKGYDVKRKAAEELSLELRRDDGVLSKDSVDSKRRELAKMQDDLSDMEIEINKKIRTMQDEAFEPLKRRIKVAVEEVSKARQIDVVLDGSNVLYGSTKADLTNDVIEKLNGMPVDDDTPASEDKDAVTSPTSTQKAVTLPDITEGSEVTTEGKAEEIKPMKNNSSVVIEADTPVTAKQTSK